MKSMIRIMKVAYVVTVAMLLLGCMSGSYQSLQRGDRDSNSSWDRDKEKPRTKSHSGKYSSKVTLSGTDQVFRFADLIQWKAQQYEVDYYLLLALVQAESSGNPDAISPANCRGLTQLSLRTARQYDPFVTLSDLHDPERNINIAGQHLAYLRKLVLRNFPQASLEERVVLLAASWNSGWGRVKSERGVPNIGETQRFTQRVLHYYRKYRWGNGDSMQG